MRRFLYFLAPAPVPVLGGILLLANPDRFLVGPSTVQLQPWVFLAQCLPAVLLLVGMGVSLYFNSSRLSLMAFFLLVVYGYVMGPFLLHGVPWDSLLGPVYERGQAVFPLLVPAVFVVLHGWGESRGAAGPLKYTLVAVAGFGIAPVVGLLDRYGVEFLDRMPRLTLPNGGFTVSLLPVFFCFMTLLVFLLIRERSFYDHYVSILFWVVLTVVLGFVPGLRWIWSNTVPLHHAVLFTGAALLFDFKVFNLAYSKAYRDQLTQIYGRMALDEKLRKLSGVYTICMIDIDHFKDFNDKYGHDAGDKVLRMVADCIQRGTGGTAFRFGGEEFTVVYEDQPLEEVREELETLRETIAGTKVRVTRKSKRATKQLERKVTISLGVAESGGNYETASEVLNAADNALFKAKEEGRNKLVEK